jgi:hypothetical protein
MKTPSIQTGSITAFRAQRETFAGRPVEKTAFILNLIFTGVVRQNEVQLPRGAAASHV